MNPLYDYYDTPDINIQLPNYYLSMTMFGSRQCIVIIIIKVIVMYL